MFQGVFHAVAAVEFEHQAWILSLNVAVIHYVTGPSAHGVGL